MSYTASNTPFPTSSTQIGYYMGLSATKATSTLANTPVSVNTTTLDIPKGVWIISGNILTSGTSNANVALEGSCTISYFGGSSITSVGFKSTSPIAYMSYAPNDIFYSNGNIGITVSLTAVTSSSSTNASTTASLSIIKIA